MWGGEGAGHEYLSNGLQMQICRKTLVYHCSLPNISLSNVWVKFIKGRRLAQLSSSE